ncbi:hypothetical protein CKAH01_16520 [Colletotrichum kahawae]|uniref:Uncharacterized protein n=1 Tax=Colletotrichum kahawae TaxID=34407 RepID=A0AAD9YFM8_COLKA|nr:hypothetical protein CKAH01_16520 [Colletotrichum kahawae]
MSGALLDTGLPTSGPIPSWNPKGEVNMKLKNTMMELSNSLQAVLVESSPKEGDSVLVENDSKPAPPPKFLLQARAYMNLKAYVLVGKEFPTSTSDFDTKIHDEAFAQLRKKNATLPGLTRATLSKIGGDCNEFYTNSLFQMVKAGADAKVYCNSALKVMRDIPGASLYEQLMILCDAKYKNQTDQDDAYRKAKSGARITLQMQSSAAAKGKSGTEQLMEALLKFQEDTKSISKDLDTLVELYMKTDVDGKTGYLAWLNDDLQKSYNRVNQEIDRYNGVFDQWKTHTGLSIGLAIGLMIFPFARIACMAVFPRKASALKSEYKTLKAQYEKHQQENEQEAKLIQFVNKMVQHFVGIEKKIADALASVKVLFDVFKNQAVAYGSIRDDLDRLGDGTDDDDLANRQIFIDYSLRAAIANLETLEVAADGFCDAISYLGTVESL